MTNLQQARIALGARLRELRRSSGLNGKDFAARLGWRATRVSKLELGQQTPTEADLISWTMAAGATAAFEELKTQLNTLETFYQEWRRLLVGGVHAPQRELLRLDDQTTVFRAFECATIPGVLQTPEFARYRFRVIAEMDRVPPLIDEAVRLRMKSQEALHAPGKHFHVVVTEAALRSSLVPPDVMVGQLERLLVASTLRSIRLGVIPFGTLLDAAPLHGFWIFDKQVVMVETISAELRLTQRDEIALYVRVFDQLAECAVYGESARREIARVSNMLLRSAGDS